MPVTADIASHLTTVRDYLRWSVSRMTAANVYFGHGTDNAWDEAIALVWSVLKLPFAVGPQVYDAVLLPAEREQILRLLERRVQERLPLPYLTNEAWFAGMCFRVDKRVIIPRSPIGELIGNGFAPWYQGEEPAGILDLCAGSGCIGIACAQYFPHTMIDLVELSESAAALAQENIALHKMNERVQVVMSDLFSALPREHQYDLIVSNPPYVDAGDIASMPAEFHSEPRMALASGDDGLEHARRILREAADYLTPNGLLVLEVGNSGLQLEDEYPDVAFTWAELERGGVGVLVMTAAELNQYRDYF